MRRFALVGISQNWRLTQPYSVTTYIVSALSVVTVLPCARLRQIFDTGLELETLQEYVLIPLDIFKESMHNKTVTNELDAWLSFMTFDEPKRIIELIESYPEFKVMYEEVYDICRNIERVMQMYSKELAELDKNTVQYMIEEQEKVIKEQEQILNQQANKLDQQEVQLNAQKEEIEALKKKLEKFCKK